MHLHLRSIFLLTIVGVAGACGASNKPAVTPNPNAAGTTIPVASDPPSSPLATKGNCSEPKTPLPPAPDRDKGIEAFLLDRPREALDLLTAAVAHDPRDRVAEAFRAAAQAKMEEAKAKAADETASIPKIPLDPIPLTQVTNRTVDGVAQLPKVRLEKQSETKNLITDFSDWETKNQLPRVGIRGRDGLPATVAPVFGRERLRETFVHRDHVAAVYEAGSIVVTSEGGKRPIAFDARNAMRGPRIFEVRFAQIVGSALLLELAYNGYAKDSNGRNGYFAAFDVSSGKLLWATDPLVANAGDAVVSGGSVITGYGFTAEPDFLFVLDLATGKVDQKIAVKSGPEAIRAKDNKIFVRTYDTDLVFKSAGGSGITPALAAANLGGGGAAPTTATPPPDAEVKCWVRNAAAGIAAKDAAAIHEAAERLAAISRDRILDELLRIEEKKLEIKGRLDLAGAQLIVVPSPPWQATPPPNAPKPSSPPPKLVKVASRAASPIRNMHPAFDPTQPFFIAPVEKGRVPEAARADIPSSYGQKDLSAIIPDQRRNQTDRLFLIYAGRFLALLKGDAVERIFDLDSFRIPPKANPQWKEFSTQELTYVQERDGVLYLCNGGGSYAKEVFGKKGFLSAIDATTGKLIWRSAPLTCNATFAMTNDHIISGYGFTEEPDFVFMVRRSDGVIVQKVPLDTGPTSIQLDGNRVHVETYSNVADFELK